MATYGPGAVGKEKAEKMSKRDIMEWIGPHECTILSVEKEGILLAFRQAASNFYLETSIRDRDLHNVGPHKIVLWRHQVLGGLRLPPPPFLCKICEYFEIPLTQIDPAAIRRAITFHIILMHNGYEHTAELFC